MRRIEIAGMIGIVVLFAVAVWAQSGPAGSSIGFTLASTCSVPMKGQVLTCYGAGGSVQMSVDGAAYTAWPPTSAPPPNYTSFTCTSITAASFQITGAGATFTNPAGTGCSFK